ncbi:MAG: hypothetical protein V7786_06845 [Sulfitobacter litoralis]|uniref:hypothetical protein n=1 Tax=Sulfitobacter litoralis TaxID=335975 RepID=UPI003003356C
MSQNKTGRPTKYTEAQVIKGIEIVDLSGEIPNGDNVKKAMCSQLGVAGGINAQSLEKEVQRLIAEREHQRRHSLVSALPKTSKIAARRIGETVEKALLDHMGEEYDLLRSAAGKKIVQLNTDLSTQRAQIHTLTEKISEKDAEIAGLEDANLDLQQQFLTANAQVESLKQDIIRGDNEEEFRAKLLVVMKETLKQGPDVAK